MCSIRDKCECAKVVACKALSTGDKTVQRMAITLLFDKRDITLCYTEEELERWNQWANANKVGKEEYNMFLTGYIDKHKVKDKDLCDLYNSLIWRVLRCRVFAGMLASIVIVVIAMFLDEAPI